MDASRKVQAERVALAALHEPIDGAAELLTITATTIFQLDDMLRAGVVAKPLSIGGREHYRLVDAIRIEVALELELLSWSLPEVAGILAGVDWAQFSLATIGRREPAALVVKWGGEADLVVGDDVIRAQAGPWDCLNVGHLVHGIITAWTGNEQEPREPWPMVGQARQA